MNQSRNQAGHQRGIQEKEDDIVPPHRIQNYP